eukprot:g17282.t1
MYDERTKMLDDIKADRPFGRDLEDLSREDQHQSGFAENKGGAVRLGAPFKCFPGDLQVVQEDLTAKKNNAKGGTQIHSSTAKNINKSPRGKNNELRGRVLASYPGLYFQVQVVEGALTAIKVVHIDQIERYDPKSDPDEPPLKEIRCFTSELVNSLLNPGNVARVVGYETIEPHLEGKKEIAPRPPSGTRFRIGSRTRVRLIRLHEVKAATFYLCNKSNSGGFLQTYSIPAVPHLDKLRDPKSALIPGQHAQNFGSNRATNNFRVGDKVKIGPGFQLSADQMLAVLGETEEHGDPAALTNRSARIKALGDVRSVWVKLADGTVLKEGLLTNNLVRTEQLVREIEELGPYAHGDGLRLHSRMERSKVFEAEAKELCALYELQLQELSACQELLLYDQERFSVMLLDFDELRRAANRSPTTANRKGEGGGGEPDEQRSPSPARRADLNPNQDAEVADMLMRVQLFKEGLDLRVQELVEDARRLTRTEEQLRRKIFAAVQEYEVALLCSIKGNRSTPIYRGIVLVVGDLYSFLVG